jgi:hypothetical protein
MECTLKLGRYMCELTSYIILDRSYAANDLRNFWMNFIKIWQWRSKLKLFIDELNFYSSR